MLSNSGFHESTPATPTARSGASGARQSAVYPIRHSSAVSIAALSARPSCALPRSIATASPRHGPRRGSTSTSVTQVPTSVSRNVEATRKNQLPVT